MSRTPTLEFCEDSKMETNDNDTEYTTNSSTDDTATSTTTAANVVVFGGFGFNEKQLHAHEAPLYKALGFGLHAGT